MTTETRTPTTDAPAGDADSAPLAQRVADLARQKAEHERAAEALAPEIDAARSRWETTTARVNEVLSLREQSLGRRPQDTYDALSFRPTEPDSRREEQRRALDRETRAALEAARAADQETLRAYNALNRRQSDHLQAIHALDHQLSTAERDLARTRTARELRVPTEHNLPAWIASLRGRLGG